MKKNRLSKWMGTLAALALAGVAAIGSAQDYGNLSGGSDRTGRNQGALSSPGRSLLTWYSPLITDQYGRILIRDNNSTAAVRAGAWFDPAITDEAQGSYVPVPATPITDPVNQAENLLRGLGAGAGNYAYAFTIPSGAGASNPLGNNFGADVVSTFEWTVEPPVAIPNQRYSRNYALSVWLPSGPTLDASATLRYPQRYFVYEIIHAGGTTVDVVDTYAGGYGWVRLGGGGRPTNKLFPYDGVNPIRIRLYNTVPRLNGHENDAVTNLAYNWLKTYPDTPYNTLVYADAVKATPVSGEFSATPIVAKSDSAILASPVLTFAARNGFTVGDYLGQSVTATKGEITAHNFQTGAKVWGFAPLDESNYTTTQDNTSAGVTSALPWAVPGVPEPGFNGVNYFSAPITNTLGTEQAVSYSPTLVDGSYEVVVWCPGSRGAESLGTGVEYRIYQGAALVDTITFNQDAARGWTQLSPRRYAHKPSAGQALRIEVTNYSANVADLGRVAFADALRFIGAANLGITSTPVHANASVIATNGGVAAPRGVVLAAAENGRIYCMDAVGNGDGTTNIFWAYPSIADPDNAGWTDPNQVAGEDGVGGVAIMPNGFDLSTAVVANIGGVDYLYVGSRNGRVYCLEMAGRGDMDLARRLPGTTRRVWTYPDDYPAASKKSNLGSIVGSLSYAVTAAGPTIFVPSSNGRIVALDALPAPVVNKTTPVRWAFPNFNQPTLGRVEMSPMIANGHVYFGTRTKAGDDRGRFYCLNFDTGAVVWQFNGTVLWDVPTNTTFIPADDFASGPAFAFGADIAGGHPDTVFVANENNWISALDAGTGAVLWTTNELGTTIPSHLTVTRINAFTGGGAGVRALATAVMCPTADGRFSALYADTAALNRFGTRRCWEYIAEGEPIISGMANGHGFLYGADQAGFLYGFSDIGDGAGNDIIGPGNQTIVENNDGDADIEPFRFGKLVFVTRDTFERLRRPTGDPQHLTFAQATAAARIVTRPAFDWGETMYAMVYDFPYQDTYAKGALAGSPAPPPTVNYSVSVQGASVRTTSVESRRYTGNTNPAGREGYAVFAMVLQSGGALSLSPGQGQMTFAINSTALTDPPRNITITPNPAASTRLFTIANPIGLILRTGDPDRQIGNTQDPSDPQNLVNGSPDVSSTPTNNEALLTATLGQLAHGGSGSFSFGVVDRSLMTLLRGPDRGLDMVRVDRNDLNWQGGKAAVIRPLDAIAFYAAGWLTSKALEEYPDQFPNLSPDYPDITRERLQVIKDPNGQTENPTFNQVTLNPTTNIVDGLPFPTRTLNPTPFQLNLDVPRFQPANQSGALDSAGATVDAGYRGLLRVFVDSNSDGLLTTGRGRRETFRSLWVAGGVQIDDRLTMGTETVDFGSLAHGTGYDPLAPTSGGSSFSPWIGPYQSLFKPITFYNEGNVNMLNIRLAKFYTNGAGTNPWELFSADNADLAWLNGALNLHATFDSQFSLTPQPILPKARPGDLSPISFRDNPRVRDNPNTGAVSQPFVTGSPDPDRPRISVTIPFGFPSGFYDWFVRVMDDRGFDESDTVDPTGNSLETSDDLNVKFRPREARLTNTFTRNTAPMMDDLIVTGAENFLHDNLQPAGLRNLNGDFLIAFTSSRYTGGGGFANPLPAAKPAEPQYRIYISGVNGTPPSGGQHPLNDLNATTPQATRWFNNAIADFPTQPFSVLVPGAPVVAGTENFGGPAFPAAADPTTGGALAPLYMAFVGDAQRQNATERTLDSRIFIAPITIDNAGVPTAGAPVVLTGDPTLRKGRPSLIQVGRNATVYYTVFGTGQSQIMYTTYAAAGPGTPTLLNTGNGFESVGSPSASARFYTGAAYTGGPTPGGLITEISFTGKLRGRPASEIFMGRIATNNRGVPTGGAIYFPSRQQEALVGDSTPGLFHASGVDWNRNGTIQLFHSLSGAAATNVEVPGTRRVDSATGVISFDLTVGGRAFLHPGLGTVTVNGSLMTKASKLFLTYQPRFIRVSTTSDQHTRPQILWDPRLIGDVDYWATNANVAINPADPVRNDRYVVTYGKAANAGQAARPYMATLRLGVQLPSAIHTQPNGSVTGMTVTGLTSYYQVDPANGRIYVQAADEGRAITITYTGVDPATGAPVAYAVAPYTPGVLIERAEGQVLIDQAVNESETSLFIDPFETNGAGRRPGLLWMAWTSTRGGAPDLYLQSLAPRLSPVARR